MNFSHHPFGFIGHVGIFDVEFYCPLGTSLPMIGPPEPAVLPGLRNRPVTCRYPYLPHWLANWSIAEANASSSDLTTATCGGSSGIAPRTLQARRCRGVQARVLA
jgi:hypothetical protein